MGDYCSPLWEILLIEEQRDDILGFEHCPHESIHPMIHPIVQHHTNMGIWQTKLLLSWDIVGGIMEMWWDLGQRFWTSWELSRKMMLELGKETGNTTGYRISKLNRYHFENAKDTVSHYNMIITGYCIWDKNVQAIFFVCLWQWGIPADRASSPNDARFTDPRWASCAFR